MSVRTIRTRLLIAVMAVLTLTGGALEAKDDLRLRARLIGPGGSNALKAKADYKLRDSRSRRKLNIEVENGTPGMLLDVLVAGEVVGTIEINDLGFGKIEFDDKASSSGAFFASSSDSDDDSDSDSDLDSDGDSDDDSDGDPDDSGSTDKEQFPSNFPVLNGGELVQVGPLSGTFQIKD